MKKITVVILNYNGKKDILECLESLSEILRFPDFEISIVVVDNSSTDGSVKAIRDKFPKVIVVENKENLGFAEGNNIGVRYALNNGADYCLLLNNDTVVEKNLLVQLIKLFNENKKIGIISPKIYFSPGFEFHYNRYKKSERGKVIWYAGGLIDWKNVLTSHRGVDEIDQGQYDKPKETDFATGCCMLVKKEIFEKIGLFDKKYFLYWEDVDFCQRAKKASFKIFYLPAAFLWHKNASSSGGAGGKTSIYYQTRNRALFALKYAPLRSKIAVIREMIKFLRSKEYWPKKASQDFFTAKFGQVKQ